MQLTVKGLCKTYANGVRALNDVSLAIPTGMFGLLGPNGAGKSTLMRIFATLLEADSGSIELGDIDVLKQKDDVRRVLGYLPQEFGFDPRVSARRMLHHFAALRGIGPSRQRRIVCDELLEKTNLHQVHHRRLGGFSGGMKQRFGIAVALLGSPRLIIVDEPTAGLDPEERTRFHNLLAEIAQNVIVILSTHIVSDVSELCQQMAVLHRGQVIVIGEPHELVRGLRGQVWQKVVDRDELPRHERQFSIVSNRLLAGRAVIHVLGDRAPDSSFTSVEPDLQDVYFRAIQRMA